MLACTNEIVTGLLDGIRPVESIKLKHEMEQTLELNTLNRISLVIMKD